MYVIYVISRMQNKIHRGSVDTLILLISFYVEIPILQRKIFPILQRKVARGPRKLVQHLKPCQVRFQA